MPYKDRATYLRKQREFYALRKARAQSSGVNRVTPQIKVQKVITPLSSMWSHCTPLTLKRLISRIPLTS